MSASSSPLIQQSSDHGGVAAQGRGLAVPMGSGARLTSRQMKPAHWLIGGAIVAVAVAAGAYGLGRHQSTQASEAAAQVTSPDVAAQTAAAQAQHSAAPSGANQAAAPSTAAVSCAQCGVVESVQAVQRKGEGSGVGAVAGGVLGGALGSQMGAGNGRTAMTVIGAIGGGLAGNEVEKRAKAVTVYRVTVRMDDGETRTLEQSQAPGVGQRVKVEGRRLKSI